ncbi:hypothetical protein MNB_ARC-1_41 [hydrothermal vent metagenome]|uniref:Lipoprotein LPP20-like domain-containing protein n=1 Tax=hydrothermal vent metagenome TaxID=652676 RepID=A0A3B1EA34_9ZZZZ
MKNLFKSLLLITIVISITGCGKNEPVKQTIEQAYIDPELKGAPKWVMIPEVKGFVAEMGSASRNAGNDFSFQREEAMADARDNLAKQISIKVNNMFKSFKSVTGSGTDVTFDKSSERVSKQIASKTLTGSKVKDTWISRSGTLYVLMVINSQNVTNMMEKAVKTSFKNDKAMYQKFLASKAQDELTQELEKFEQ